MHETAKQEFDLSISWYETEQEGLGERFANAVRARLQNILERPKQGTKTRKGFREVKVDRTFPFLIIFRYYPEEEMIYVSSIFHTSRDPDEKYNLRPR